MPEKEDRPDFGHLHIYWWTVGKEDKGLDRWTGRLGCSAEKRTLKESTPPKWNGEPLTELKFDLSGPTEDFITPTEIQHVHFIEASGYYLDYILSRFKGIPAPRDGDNKMRWWGDIAKTILLNL